MGRRRGGGAGGAGARKRKGAAKPKKMKKDQGPVAVNPEAAKANASKPNGNFVQPVAGASARHAG